MDDPIGETIHRHSCWSGLFRRLVLEFVVKDGPDNPTIGKVVRAPAAVVQDDFAFAPGLLQLVR